MMTDDPAGTHAGNTLGDTSQLATELRMVVGRLARRVRQSHVGDLTPSQLSALAAIDRLGKARLCDVAAAEGVRAPTAARVVDSLEEAGLVTRAAVADDRRAVRIALTPAGRGALRRIRSARTAFLVQKLEGLSPHELAALRDALPVLDALAEVDR